MKNNSVTTSTSALKLGTTMLATGIDLVRIRIFFEYLFKDTISLKERNKYLLLFMYEYVNKNNTSIINKILSDNAFKDLHPSLLKSALIITENVQDIEQSREKVMEVFTSKM